MIKNGRLVIFSPFVNKDYTNTWGDRLQVEGRSVSHYYTDKDKGENYLSDVSKWWANGRGDPVLPCFVMALLS